MKEYYAHSIEGKPPAEWHRLEDHLRGTAKLAAQFAAEFGCEEWGEILGQHHDLGKGINPWQAYLRKANSIIDEFAKFYKGHPNHATVGAQWLFQNSKQAGKLLAYCIAGHHCVLPD